jgi:hypothetical protein
MRVMWSRTLAASCLAGGLASAGCWQYRDCVDPCWPERYNCEARHEVLASFSPQVANGHILDQTIWNWQFEAGTDRLNGAGMLQLDTLVRRRPQPDTRIFLQTARDAELAYDPANPDKLVEARRDLDAKRIAAIQRYLTAQTAGRPLTFDVTIHDPMEVGMPAIWHQRAMDGLRIGIRYNVPSIASIQTATTSFSGAGGGAAPPGQQVPGAPGYGGAPGGVPGPGGPPAGPGGPGGP